MTRWCTGIIWWWGSKTVMRKARIKPAQMLVVAGILAFILAIILPSIRRYRRMHEVPCYRRINHLGRALSELALGYNPPRAEMLK